MDDRRPFHELVVERLRQELGEPTPTRVDGGTVYHWTVKCRGTHDLSIYITLDAPELPNYAHLFISDPAQRGRNKEPVVDFIFKDMSRMADVLAVIRDKTQDCD